MKLNISYAPVWAECPAAARMKRFYGNNLDSARTGILCHQLTELLINTGRTGSNSELLDYFQKKSSSDAFLTDEAISACREAALYCRTAAGNAPIFTEKPVSLVLDGTQFNGRLDFSFVRDETLFITDLKFGRSPVKADRNWQLIMYALAELPYYTEINFVEMTIIQPLDYINGAVKKIRMPVPELMFASEKLKARLKTVFDDNPPQNTGAHCRMCDSKEYCKAYLSRAVSLSENLDYDLNAVPAMHLGDLYEYLSHAIKTIEKTKNAIESRMFYELEKGNVVGDWLVGKSKSRAIWIEDVKRIRETGEMLGVDLVKEKPVALSSVKNLKAVKPALPALTMEKPGKRILKKLNKMEIKEIFK